MACAGELWVSLMEKAYAKLHGSFFSLDGGSLGDALVDLTGGVLSKLKLDSEEGEMLVDGGTLWTRLELYCSWGYVMCAMHKVKPAAENATGPGGLLLNYTYNIVDCHKLSDGAQLICMHNPWPSGRWHGAWGKQSREWKNPGAILQACCSVHDHSSGVCKDQIVSKSECTWRSIQSCAWMKD